MRVEIVKAFSVDTPAGEKFYAPGEAATGQRNWVDKGLAKEAEEAEPTAKSDEKPKG